MSACMRIIITRFFALIVVLALVVAGGCGKKQANEIKIGVVLPLTGDGAAYGQKEKEGIEIALEELNAATGLKESRIVGVYEDSQGSPGPAVAATQKLIFSDHMSVIIGDAFSSPTLAMVPIIDKNRVILMSPTASSPKLSGSSPYFFRVWPSDLAEGETVAEIAVEKLKLRQCAVLVANNEYAQGLKNVFEASIVKRAGEISISETYNDGDRDFRGQLSKIKRKSPQAIYLAGYYKELALILQQVQEMRLDCQIFSCGTFHEPEILKLAGSSAEGVIFVQPYFDRRNPDTTSQRFVRAYEQRFKSEAGVYAAHAYDAVKVLGAAIRVAGGNADAIRDSLLAYRNYPGVTGKITFAPGGDVIKPSRTMTVRNGEFVDY